MKKSEAPYLIVDARVRYWEDATVNGEKDTDGTLIPFRAGNRWRPVINLATGYMCGWPKGTEASVHYKVCDDGRYWLADKRFRGVFKYLGDYVPDSILCVGDRGYGDYIILNVGPNGIIQGWKKPIIEDEQWEALT